MSILKYPYSNLHEINLDWIIEQLNAEGYVLSVNGKHGTVTLTGEDINRTPNNPQTVEQALSSQGSSIQSVQTKIGVTALPTTAQTITGAIAEHETDITNINNKIGTTALPTTAQTITGAIAEHESDITSINTSLLSKMSRYRFNITGHSEISTTDISEWLTAYGTIYGPVAVEFFRSDTQIIVGTMIYNLSTASYGAGILVSYYNNGLCQILNTNNVITIKQVTIAT